MGAVVAALYRQDWELLRRSLIDVVIEPQRAKLIPFLSEVKKPPMKQEQSLVQFQVLDQLYFH